MCMCFSSRISRLSSCTKVAAISVVIVTVALTTCLVLVNKKDAPKAPPSAALSLSQTSNQEDITNTTGERPAKGVDFAVNYGRRHMT